MAYALLCLRCDVVICILLAYFVLERTLNLEEKQNIRHWQSSSRIGMSNETWTLQGNWKRGGHEITKPCTLERGLFGVYSAMEISFYRKSKAVS
jgi:hypothetical protein